MHVLAVHELLNGETLVISTWVKEWTFGDLIMPAGFQESDDYVFPAADEEGRVRSINLTMYWPPRDGDCLMCAELSGFRVPGGEAQVLYPNAARLTRDQVLDRKARAVT
jgi:hypothetical protein